MKIIALYGRGNIGKSTAIRRFFDKYVATNSLFTINKQQIDTVDIRIRATYKKSTVLGIISNGDNKQCIKEGLTFVGECDVLICASRSKGGAMDLIKETSKDIIWVGKETIAKATDSLSDSIVDWIREEQANQTAARLNGLLQLLI